ncbi:DUF2523 domain-containing protein [Ralstonia solanacearum]|uniref:DUF2523 domain-containing protein n=1 Tax=Ralstonia solanacearum TaxID=305 RepID=UPI0023063859|nr:DUF2523 domain-containing protein [Ralstonia solanacearum]MDB0564655.1 DUF2523 domain-containing protein [Ralstonia solanacearum]MDB0577157.1 DUF2523 domain-containing protein [Ralstonia solanacearum]
MSAIVNAISAFASWLLKAFLAVFQALWDITLDLCIEAFDLFLTALSTVLALLPAPAFLSGVSLQSLFGQLPSDLLYFLGVFNVAQGLALVGAGYGFRMLRKVVTLFQW